MIKIDLKNIEQKNPLPTVIQTESAVITDSDLIRKYSELKEKKENGEFMSVKEQLQFAKLKKQGDNVTFRNKILQQKTPTPSKGINLTKLNKAPNNITTQKAESIINDIYDGLTLIDACNKQSIKPRAFLSFIDNIENASLKRDFINARIVLAEYYLHRRETLESDLLSGRVDSSTYSVLSNDYKYLAGKLAPLAYGEKIQLDAVVLNTSTALPSTDKLKELNKLLQPIDIEYTESR